MATGYPHSRKYVLTHQTPLCFGDDGKFRILHLTDIHKVCPEMDDDEDRSIPDKKSAATLENIRKCLDIAKPDLVVFGGDNIGGHWEEMTAEYAERALNDITAEIKERNIPLAVVFGNHDAQNERNVPFLSREIQMTCYMNYDNFRGCYNEADMYGCGNCHLPVFGKNGNTPVWNIWCIDSNDYPRDGFHNETANEYDTVHADQIEWYESTVRSEKEKFGRTVPAILFQHMPVNQEYDFITECGKEDAMYESGGRFFRAKEGAIKEGLLRESPCPPPRDRSQFEAWVRCGDIKAAFFGHDHTNTFCFEKEGIKLYQTIGAGYESYGIECGGRLITLYDDGETFETETIITGRRD